MHRSPGRDPTVDESRSRIHDDLRGILGGELLFEPIERAAYAHDASLYEIDPLGVVVPRTRDDVVALVRYAAEHVDPAPRPGGRHRPGRRDPRAGSGHRLQPPFPPDRRDRARSRRGPAGGRARRPQRPAGPAGPEDRPRPEPFRVADDRRDGRARRRRHPLAPVRDDRRPRRAALGRLRQRRGRRASASSPGPRPTTSRPSFKDLVVRKLGTIYRRQVDLLARQRPKARRNRAGYALGDAASPVGIDLAQAPGRLGGDARAGHRDHAPDRADPAGPGGGGPAVRPDRRCRRRPSSSA